VELKHYHGDRQESAAYLAEALDGLYAGNPHPSPLLGGRTAGLQRLRVFPVTDYQEKRNDVGEHSGASMLSPYIRHGCLSLTEAKRHAIGQIGASRSVKWIQELAWRQFWQLLYARYGSRIFQDMEEPKVPLGDDDTLPDDIANAETGLACMDISLRGLYETGYMHNHARMWFAAYLIHHRKIRWQVGAKLFYRFLLDGDPASNTLSWQWVASTFSHKPYFFNRQNVEKYSRHPETKETYCTNCPAAQNRICPFDASYEVLGKRLFGKEYEHEQHSGSWRNTGKNRDMVARRPSPRR
jgi:deoxyribodipyrimidine photo-lyase